MTFYKEWLLRVCLHYTFSHTGYCEIFLCFVLMILYIRAVDLGKPGLPVENYRNPIVFTERWKSHEKYLLHVSWKPFPESSAHQFLSSLLSTFNNCFYSTAKNWYILQRKHWGRQDCSSQYNPSFPRKGDTLNLDLQVYAGCVEVNNLQMAAMHWRKDKKILVRYAPNCAFEHFQKYNLFGKKGSGNNLMITS